MIRLIQKQWLGQDIVVWCDNEGTICVAQSVCPHLGSSLGPAAGGRVRDGHLVCPFHGFTYDVAGNCVATPYAEPPASVRLKVFLLIHEAQQGCRDATYEPSRFPVAVPYPSPHRATPAYVVVTSSDLDTSRNKASVSGLSWISRKVFDTREILGLVFAWWGIDGRPPQWDLPDEPSARGEWSGMELRTLRFPGHPQETTQNSVDLAHLQYVHGYDDVKAAGSATADGAVLVSRFDFRSRRRIAGFAHSIYEFSVTAYVHGLGYSFVDIRENTIGMDSRLWVLATPVDGTFIDLVLAGQVRDIRKTKRLIAGLAFLPVKLRTSFMNKIWTLMQKRDVLQDIEIWGRKRYRPHPSLCRSDGAIGRYRRYCKQFYPHGDNSGDRW